MSLDLCFAAPLSPKWSDLSPGSGLARSAACFDSEREMELRHCQAPSSHDIEKFLLVVKTKRNVPMF
jgi:hypothetical protein